MDEQMNPKILLIVAFILSPCFLMAELFSRSETLKFHRDNPVDQRATNYQGRESFDLDGDGEADFLILLNGGATNTTSRQVTFEVSGPSVRRTYISEDLQSLESGAQDYRAQYPYVLSSAYGLKTVFIKFEFSGGKKSKIYSNQIWLSMSSNDLQWMTNSIGIQIENGSIFTTNSNISVNLSAPDQAVLMSWGESSNAAVSMPMLPYHNLFVFSIITNLTNINSRSIWVQLKNGQGQIRIIKTNIIYVPWRNFSVAIDGGSSSATNRACSLSIHYFDSVTKMRVANEPTFTGSPWESSVATKDWSLSSGSGLKGVFLQFTNETYGLFCSGISDSINAPSISGMSLGINGGSLYAANTNVTLNVTAANAQVLRISTNSNFSDGSGWMAYATTIPWIFVGDGTTNKRFVYAQFSNTVWAESSGAVSTSICPDLMSGLSLLIANGNTRSASNNVTVSISCSNATHMILGSNSAFSHASWEVLANSKNWPLVGGVSGTTNWCYAQFSNENWKTVSSIIADDIYCDTNFRYNSIAQGYQRIPAGSFAMGLPGVVTPIHTNNLSSFYMSIYETRFVDWTNVTRWALTNGYSFNVLSPNMGANNSGSEFQPVTRLDWYDVIKWCNALSEKEGRTPVYYTNSTCLPGQVYRSGQIDIATNMVLWKSNGYRLPTEAEWEYACRAGSTTSYFWGDGDPTIDTNYSWSSANNNPLGTKVSGLKLPNSWGILDASGNVWEWCFDWYSTYPSAGSSDPLGENTGTYRTLRGGSYHQDILTCRSGWRTYATPSYMEVNLGFRPVTSSP